MKDYVCKKCGSSMFIIVDSYDDRIAKINSYKEDDLPWD